MTVTDAFKDDSARAAIKALRGLEQTAIMLEKWAPEIFPAVEDFGRIMMESAAKAIRDAWADAIRDVENAERARQIAAAEDGVAARNRAEMEDRVGGLYPEPQTHPEELEQETPAMSATWIPHRYGSGATLNLPNGLRASVHWEASERLPVGVPHYNVTVLGIRLPGRSETMDEAKARAESGLRTALRAALDAIGD